MGNIDDRCIVYDELGMATVGLESIKALSNELKVICRTIESNIYIGNENYAIRGEFKLQPSTTNDPVFLFHFAGKNLAFHVMLCGKRGGSKPSFIQTHESL